MDKCGLLARLGPSADRGLVFGTLAFGTDTCNIITFTYTYYYPLLSEGEKNVRDGVGPWVWSLDACVPFLMNEAMPDSVITLLSSTDGCGDRRPVHTRDSTMNGTPNLDTSMLACLDTP